MRRAARRDANEQEIVAMARRCGFQMVMDGPLDWWAALRGRWMPVEIKAGRNGYTVGQKLFIGNCEAAGNPVLTWRSIADVILAANSWGNTRQQS